MKTLIGGAVAAALGLIGLVVWWTPFMQLLAGMIPFVLLCGGALAIYLGFDEIKGDAAVDTPSAEEVENYKHQVEELKKEVESLKSSDKEEKKAAKKS